MFVEAVAVESPVELLSVVEGLHAVAATMRVMNGSVFIQLKYSCRSKAIKTPNTIDSFLTPVGRILTYFSACNHR